MAWSDINQKSPWVTTPGQYMLQSAQAAEGIGRTFSQGMAIGQRNKEFEAEAPLRQAQTDLAKLQAELARMKQQEDKVKLEAMIEQRNTLHEAQKEIGGWMAQRGRLERIGLDDPQTVQAGYDWWAKRGKLLTNPEARALYDDWDNTVKAVRTENDRVKRDRESAMNILERQMEVEGARQEGRRDVELERTRRSQLQSESRRELERLRAEGLANPRRPQSKVDFVGQFIRSMSQRYADDENISIDEARKKTEKIASDYWTELTSGAPTPVAPATRGPVRVNTIQEALSLPPGTEFIDPNGIKRVRP